MARPWPVFPEVGSTIVPPGRSCPPRSAASIMRRPIRSFTLPPGFSISSLAKMAGRTPRTTLWSRTSGVLPMPSRNDSSTCTVPPPAPGDPGPYCALLAPPRPEHMGDGYLPEAGSVSDDTQAPARESILVVEDDEFIARLLRAELAGAGYEVRTASDGVEALDAAFERCPDLVLADVMMPNMDGYEMTRRLREDPRTEAVSIIMLTARGLSGDKLEGLTAGADDYIVKPFDADELLARVGRVVRRAV